MSFIIFNRPAVLSPLLAFGCHTLGSRQKKTRSNFKEGTVSLKDIEKDSFFFCLEEPCSCGAALRVAVGLGQEAAQVSQCVGSILAALNQRRFLNSLL